MSSWLTCWVDNTNGLFEQAEDDFAEGHWLSGLGSVFAGTLNGATFGGASALAEVATDKAPDVTTYIANVGTTTEDLLDESKKDWKEGNYVAGVGDVLAAISNTATFGGTTEGVRALTESDNKYAKAWVELETKAANALTDGDASNDFSTIIGTTVGTAGIGTGAVVSGVANTAKDMYNTFKDPTWWSNVWGIVKMSAPGSYIVAGGKTVGDFFMNKIDVDYESYKEKGITFNQLVSDIRTEGKEAHDKYTEFRAAHEGPDKRAETVDSDLGLDSTTDGGTDATLEGSV